MQNKCGHSLIVVLLLKDGTAKFHLNLSSYTFLQPPKITEKKCLWDELVLDHNGEFESLHWHRQSNLLDIVSDCKHNSRPSTRRSGSSQLRSPLIGILFHSIRFFSIFSRDLYSQDQFQHYSLPVVDAQDRHQEKSRIANSLQTSRRRSLARACMDVQMCSKLGHIL